MKKLLVLLLLLALTTPAAWAQKIGKLPAPQVTLIRAVDYSEGSPEMGWWLYVEWQLVPGAEGYAIRLVGKDGMTPRMVDDFPYPQEAAKWKATDEQHFVHHSYSDTAVICCLDEKQKLKFRLRAIDLDNPDKIYGKATDAFAFKLKKYGNAPVLPHTKRPTLEIYSAGSSD